jgi:hypothetical protein
MPSGTAAGGSHHLPHPDPARMALNVGGFGEEGREHWLIGVDAQEVAGPIAYPDGYTPDAPVGFGRGRWLTPGGGSRYDVWALV